MESICKNHFLQLLYRKIDGATLLSRNERNLNCVVTFQTHSILQRFMLRFDMLQLDCNDHLYVYDGAHAVGTYKVSLPVAWFQMLVQNTPRREMCSLFGQQTSEERIQNQISESSCLSSVFSDYWPDYIKSLSCAINAER